MAEPVDLWESFQQRLEADTLAASPALTCAKAEGLLAEYAQNELAEPQRLQVRAHVRECDACADELVVYERALGNLSVLPLAQPDRDLWPAVAERIERQAARRDWLAPLRQAWKPGYGMAVSAAAAVAVVALFARQMPPVEQARVPEPPRVAHSPSGPSELQPLKDPTPIKKVKPERPTPQATRVRGTGQRLSIVRETGSRRVRTRRRSLQRPIVSIARHTQPRRPRVEKLPVVVVAVQPQTNVTPGVQPDLTTRAEAAAPAVLHAAEQLTAIVDMLSGSEPDARDRS
jgi:hypothetical protein